MSKFTPYAQQDIAIKKIENNKSFCLFGGIGSGKTAIVLSAIKNLKEKGEILKKSKDLLDEEYPEHVLIVAPKKVAEGTWEQEVKKWENFSDLNIINYATAKNDNEKNNIIKNIKQTEPSIYIVNYDKLDDFITNTKNEFHNEWYFPTLILDEAHHGKNGQNNEISFVKTNKSKGLCKTLEQINSKNTGYWRDSLARKIASKEISEKEADKITEKMMQRICSKEIRDSAKPIVSRKIAMTGTPAPNKITDTYTIADMVMISGESNPLGINIELFQKKFMHSVNAVLTPTGYKDSIFRANDGAEKEIAKILEENNLATYLDNSDRPMPKLTITTDSFEPSDKIKNEIKKIEEDKENNNLTITTKSRQITSGFIYENIDGKKTARKIDDQKKNIFLELCQKNGDEPILCVCSFTEEIADLKSAINKIYGKQTVGVINGKSKNLATTIEKWNNKDLKVLFIQPQAGGEGLNLQEGGHIMCIYSSSFNLEETQQVIGRLYRTGQTEDVEVHRIVAAGTIDEDIIEDQERKKLSQEELLNGLIPKQREINMQNDKTAKTIMEKIENIKNNIASLDEAELNADVNLEMR